MSEKPSPEQIEHMLINLPSKPSERFYTIMRNQVWNNTTFEPRRRQGLVSAYTVIAIGLLLFGSCSFFIGFYTRDFDYAGDRARERINKALITTIPESSINLHFTENYFFFWEAYGRFDASKEDIEAWLDGDVACSDVWRQSNLDSVEYDDDWWQLNEANLRLQGRCTGENNINFDIYIDQRDESMWIVYLRYFND